MTVRGQPCQHLYIWGCPHCGTPPTRRRTAEAENALFMSASLLKKARDPRTPVAQRDLVDMLAWVRKLLEADTR